MEKNKINILHFSVLSVLLIATFVVALSFTTFDNSLAEENLTFTGDNSFIRNLTVYRYANFTDVFMNLTGDTINAKTHNTFNGEGSYFNLDSSNTRGGIILNLTNVKIDSFGIWMLYGTATPGNLSILFRNITDDTVIYEKNLGLVVDVVGDYIEYNEYDISDSPLITEPIYITFERDSTSDFIRFYTRVSGANDPIGGVFDYMSPVKYRLGDYVFYTDDDEVPVNITFESGFGVPTNPSISVGSIILPSDPCYQESFNTSNQTGIDGDCELNYSGNISSTYEEHFTDYNYLFDGDWDTFAYHGLALSIAYTDIYYKIPNDKNSAEIKFRLGDTEYLYGIPDSCVSGDYLNIQLADPSGNGAHSVSCYNGTSLITIYSLFYWNNFYETAIIWDFESTYENIWSLSNSGFTGLNATLTKFNNSATSATNVFSGDENFTQYIKVLKHSDAINSSMYIEGTAGANIINPSDSDFTNIANGDIYNSFYNIYTGTIQPKATCTSSQNSISRSGGYCIFGLDGLTSKLSNSNCGQSNLRFSGIISEYPVNCEDQTYSYQLCYSMGSLQGKLFCVYNDITDDYILINATAAMAADDTSLTISNDSVSPSNARLYLNNSLIFQNTGTFLSKNQTSDFSTELNSHLSTCSPDSENYCTIPIISHSDTAGILELSDIDITYTNISKTLNFLDSINDALDLGACTGGVLDELNCTIPFLFSSDAAGILGYSSIDLTYDSIPHATQISPDDYAFSFETQNFNCSSLDEVNLKNITVQLFYPNGTFYDSESTSITGVSNSSSLSISFSETGGYLWNCKVFNNESFSYTTYNRTLKVRGLTLTPQTWLFSSPRLGDETKWSNSLVVTNPTDIEYAELNMITDTLAESSSIVVKDSSLNVLSNTFNQSNGKVKFNATILPSTDTVFYVYYNTSSISVSQELYNETVNGNVYRIINLTVTANSSRSISDIESYLEFDDSETVEIVFLKCTDSVCSEDITNRSDVVFSDTDSDGTSDRIDWFVESLSNQSYQIRKLYGFPVQVSQDVTILNEPVRPFDNVDWENSITYFNPNSFETESILKIELPFGAREIELDGVPKNLQFDPYGTIAPYILIIDKDDPTHKETVFLLPGQTKVISLEYITDSVTVLPEIFQPSFYEVDEDAEINQILRIKNQADDTVTNIEHNIPISFAKNLRACIGEFENGCPGEGDEDEALIFDEESNVNGNYELNIDSIDASEVKYVTISYFIPTIEIIDEVQGRSSVVGYDQQLNFKRFTFESISPLKLLDVRYNTGVSSVDVVSARLCDSNNVCEEEIDISSSVIHLGTFDIGDRKVVEFWYTEDPTSDEPMGMSFVGRFLEFGKEFDLTDSPMRFVLGWASTEVNGKVLITTGKIIAILIGLIALILLTIFIIYLRRRKDKNG